MILTDLSIQSKNCERKFRFINTLRKWQQQIFVVSFKKEYIEVDYSIFIPAFGDICIFIRNIKLSAILDIF